MRREPSAYTLIELLTVMAIVGIMVGIAVPAIKSISRGDASLAASRQLMDDLGRARQLALSQRTTVYMVFCPSNTVDDAQNETWKSQYKVPDSDLLLVYDKQLTGYALVTLRSVGDQPGHWNPHYLSRWRNLPDGNFIGLNKFGPRIQNPPWILWDPPNNPNGRQIGLPGLVAGQGILGFEVTNGIPFPSEFVVTNGPPYVPVPFIAFNSMGQLTSGQDEFIPLGRGNVMHQYGIYANVLVPVALPPDIVESPRGNTTNSFNVIHIDALTGRARLEQQEISGQ